MSADQDDGEADRVRTRALLEATHDFPCDYTISVIAHNSESVTEAIREAIVPNAGAQTAQAAQATVAGPVGAAEPAAEARPRNPVSYTVRPSSGGKYLSHRFEVRVQKADEVLELYARVRAVAGVVTIF